MLFATGVAWVVGALTYSGRLCGVQTQVTASDDFRRADVTVQGPGVRVSGRGRIDRRGVLKLDDAFETYLRRRRVELRNVRVATDRANISVAVDVPLLGSRVVVLLRGGDEARL